MIEQVVLYAIAYLVFVYLESLAINGVVEAFKGSCVNDMNKGKICDGNIFYKISPSFFERNKGKAWTMPWFGCVKCASSGTGGVFFWGTILPIFSFHYFEIWLYILNTFILVSLNWVIYKKL